MIDSLNGKSNPGQRSRSSVGRRAPV